MSWFEVEEAATAAAIIHEYCDALEFPGSRAKKKPLLFPPFFRKQPQKPAAKIIHLLMQQPFPFHHIPNERNPLSIRRIHLRHTSFAWIDALPVSAPGAAS